MVLPEAIVDAACDADLNAVQQWVQSNDVNDRREPLCVEGRSDETLLELVAGNAETKAHVELARYLLEQGADATLSDVFQGDTPLHSALGSSGAFRLEMASLLLDAAGVRDHINAYNAFGETPFYHGMNVFLYSASPGFESERWDGPLCRRLIALLLREGASLDDICERENDERPLSVEEYVDEIETWYSVPERNVPDFVATKELIRDFRAAGSWRAYTKGLRKQVLGLRSLALRGRAGTRDEVMRFIVKSPNEIAWKILSYWPTELDV